MCGINGFNFSDEELIKKMNNKVKHRGPDDSGFWVDPSASSGSSMSLGHQRLSIIDLSERGHQPMQDDKAVIVFNGEIYNFKEIKKELTNYNFKSNSDTEVILASYQKWGKDCLQKFNGIFSFAIWDKEKKELFLARDRIGVKPLYYYYNSNKLIFSSEIKAILEHPCVKREVDIEALNHYFRVLYIPGPLTMFKGIKKLEPGQWLIYKNNEIEIKRYWSVLHTNDANENANYANMRINDTKKEIQDLMLDAVKMQLVSDRPLGVFLSGGIDSTSVLGNMVKLGHKNIKTFSVGFDIKDPDNKFNGDFCLARKTAKHYNTDHHEIKISAKDIRDNIEDVVYHLDEPICNTTQVATYLLSKFAKEKVSVVLGGDGGDELFGGYERYRLSYIMSRFGWLMKLAGVAGKDWYYPKGIDRYAKFMFQDEEQVSRILNSDIGDELTKGFYKVKFKEEIRNKEIRNKGMATDEEIRCDNVDGNSHVPIRIAEARRAKAGYSHTDFERDFMMMDFKTWLVDESLMRTDKMTMAHGLEQRVPILDHRLAELAYQIPSSMKLGVFKNQTKLIWKQAMNEFLPEHVKESAHKKVWLAPMSDWIRYDLHDWVGEVLNKDYADTSEFINFDEVQEMFKEHCEKKKYHLHLIWAVICFQIWWRLYITNN